MDWIYTTSFGNTMQSVGDWSICRYSPQKDCTACVGPHPPRWRSSGSPIVAASTSRAVLELMQTVVRNVSDCASQNRGIISRRLQYCASLRVRFLNSAHLQWLTTTANNSIKLRGVFVYYPPSQFAPGAIVGPGCCATSVGMMALWY